LLKIPGIGPARRRALLHVFGSVQGVKEATVEAIAGVPGFGEASARRVLSALGVERPVTTDSALPASCDALPDVPPADFISDIPSLPEPDA
jgi:excinuclease ABC subunit C